MPLVGDLKLIGVRMTGLLFRAMLEEAHRQSIATGRSVSVAEVARRACASSSASLCLPYRVAADRQSVIQLVAMISLRTEAIRKEISTVLAILLILVTALYIYAARQTFLVMALTDPDRDRNAFITPGIISGSARAVILGVYYAFWPLLMAYGWWTTRHERVCN